LDPASGSVSGLDSGFFFRLRNGRVNVLIWDDRLNRRLTLSAIIGATFWLPTTNGAIQPLSSFMVGVFSSQLGTRHPIGCQRFSQRKRVITVPPASTTAKAPPAMSQSLGAPNMAYCSTPRAVMANS